jgi:hypothetical protein
MMRETFWFQVHQSLVAEVELAGLFLLEEGTLNIEKCHIEQELNLQQFPKGRTEFIAKVNMNKNSASK